MKGETRWVGRHVYHAVSDKNIAFAPLNGVTNYDYKSYIDSARK